MSLASNVDPHQSAEAGPSAQMETTAKNQSDLFLTRQTLKVSFPSCLFCIFYCLDQSYFLFDNYGVTLCYCVKRK